MPLPVKEASDLRAILRRLGAAFGPGCVPIAQGRALEAWLMMRLAHHAHRVGAWTVTLTASDGNPLRLGDLFVFASRQQGIPAMVRGGPSHIRLRFRSEPELELHSSLQWIGRSGASHECDISLLPKAIADPLRLVGPKAPSGLPIVAFECKDRSITGQTDEMRQTVARLFDLALVTKPSPIKGCRMFESATGLKWGGYRKRYRDFFSSGAYGVVRAGKFSTGAKKLGDHYVIGLYKYIYDDAASIGTAEQRFMDVLSHINLIA